MRKKILLFLLPIGALALFCVAVIQFNLRFMPFTLVNKLPDNTATNTALRQRLNQIYDTNFIFDTKSTVTSKIYLPRYMATDSETAALYGALFDFPEPYESTEDYYVFGNDKKDKRLYVDQFFGHILYENSTAKTNIKETAAAIQTNKDAIAAASRFIQSYHVEVPHQDVAVRFDGQSYTVQYIDTLDNYPNYAFPATIKLGKDGQISRFEQYAIEYDRIDTITLKTMKEAYLELPLDIDPGVRVDLKSCRVVYIFEDSVVQPAFLFEGEMTGDNIGETTFQCFVKAAKFGAK